MKHKQEALPVKRRLIMRTLTGRALLQLQVHRLCHALRPCQPAPRSLRVRGRRPQNTEGPSLLLARAFLPASTAQLPAGGFRAGSAITVSCSPAPASLQRLSKLPPPPVSSEPQLRQGARALSRFILPWVFCVISGGSGCSLYPLFLCPLESR